jgi:hypothetical protein
LISSALTRSSAIRGVSDGEAGIEQRLTWNETTGNGGWAAQRADVEISL